MWLGSSIPFCQLRLQFLDALLQWADGFVDLGFGEAACDVLGTVPVEGFNLDAEEALGGLLHARRDEGPGEFGVLLGAQDFGSSEDLQAGLEGRPK